MTAEHSAPLKPLSQRGSLGTVLRGLQFKWTLLLTILLFIIAVSGNILIRRDTERMVLRQAISNGIKQCEAMGALAAPDLLANDTRALERLVRRLEDNPAMLYIQLYDRTGALLAERSRATIQTPPIVPSAPSPDQLVPDTGPLIARLVKQSPQWHAPGPPAPLFMDVARPVMLDPSKPTAGAVPAASGAIGYVRVGLDLSDAQKGLSTFLERLHYVSIVTIVILIPVAFMIVRRVTAPLNELNRVVTQLADGNFRVRANIPRGDEIGQLAAAFNSMANELSTSNDRLVKLNAELEDRVLQRTRQLKDLAARDPLTGLYNRRHLGEVLSRRFSEAERYGNDLACLMIDLDNFKKVNDQYGHEMGDTLLILTATVISSQLRGADVGSRFGGDEFCILLPQTSAEQARQVGERIVERFGQELLDQLPDHSTRFGISVGVAGLRELNLVHPDELMKAADQALYNAKDAGKNRIHLAETLS